MLTISGIPIAQIPASAFVASNIDHSGYEMRVRFDKTLSITASRRSFSAR